jgi:hypothetical protein
MTLEIYVLVLALILTYVGTASMVLVSSAVDRGFESRYRVKPKNYKVCMCCCSGKHAALGRKSKDSLAWK